MRRRKLAILVGIVIAIGALTLMFWPTAEMDDHAQEEAEAETPEGVVTLSDEQIGEAGIQLAAVRAGAAVELVFPATVAASPTASARIDARASGVVRSVGKTLGDYVARGETVARIESADAAALASQLLSLIHI